MTTANATQTPDLDFEPTINDDDRKATTFPYIIYYNRSDKHADTSIEKGGFGIKADDPARPPAPIGPIEDIPHGDTTAKEAVARQITCAVIGATGMYRKLRVADLTGNDNDRGTVYISTKEKINYPKSSGAMTFFVVLACDPNIPALLDYYKANPGMFTVNDPAKPALTLYQIDFKSNNVINATRVLTNMQNAASLATAHMGTLRGTPYKASLPRFALWHDLRATATSIMTGAAGPYNCTHLSIAWRNNPNTDADKFVKAFLKRDAYGEMVDDKAEWLEVQKFETGATFYCQFVGGTLYRHFEAMRMQLDDILHAGYRRPLVGEQAILAEAQRLLTGAPANASAPALAAPQGVAVNGDVNI
jgi:hypothetical protein